MFTTRISTVRLSAALDAPMRTVPLESEKGRPSKTKRKSLRPDRSPSGDPDRIGNEKGGPTGFIVIRLGEAGDLRDVDWIDTLAELVEKAQLSALAEILQAFDLGMGHRLITSTKPEALRELEDRAKQSEFPPIRSLLSYWIVDARKQADRIDEIVKRLRATPGVADAYAHSSGAEPVVNAANDPYAAQQGHLDAAAGGIDARWAWTQPNSDGNGIALCDIERGWTLTHEDFAGKTPTLIEGENRPGSADHGTAVLGEMIADDNALGGIGIAPEAGPISVASHWDQTTNTSGFVAEAMVTTIQTLSSGDIVIIEVQTTAPSPFGAPTELVDDHFDAIRLASALGFIVFEAAGNGGQNLDTITNAGGDQVLNPGSADFRDSGAIICGAAEDALPHNRAIWGGGQSSSFGARVNCYGWGRNVVTAGYGDLDAGGGDVDKEYTGTFSGTSSATPIITGAGLIIQGMHLANTGARLSPAQMRLILSNPATGTAQGGGVAGNIGVMPNLHQIIEDELGLNADVYLRDNLGDDGSVPTIGGISASPDIIARPVAVADPALAFGEGSGTENSNTQGFEIEAGQDNFLYARMKNRGAADANGVTARIYWSEVSTLVTPDMWTLIGVTAPVNVPMGDTLVVTDPLTWAELDIPGEGHYCLVGILDHPADPAPLLPSPTDWDGFRAFIRNQNNVTWRNFNVIDDVFDPDADPSVQDFLIANFPDARRYFDFVIERRIPRSVQVWLEVPMQIAKAFLRDLDLKVKVDQENQRVRMLLPAASRMVVPRVLLPAKARLNCRFMFKGFSKHGNPGNMISIGQHFKKQEVGRVTWHFSKKRDPKEIC